MLADAHTGHQGVILASGRRKGSRRPDPRLASELIGALAASALIGLGTAVWHLPAMGTLSTRFPERRATALAVHGVGARVSNTLTPLAIGALLVAFAWGDVVRVQRLPAILVALVRWRGLAS